ncbi:MAG: hypothetical protein K0R46_3447, partial [Herbinix sp.]|nr:hypothetical protein [Herbinix sp.]
LSLDEYRYTIRVSSSDYIHCLLIVQLMTSGFYIITISINDKIDSGTNYEEEFNMLLQSVIGNKMTVIDF